MRALYCAPLLLLLVCPAIMDPVSKAAAHRVRRLHATTPHPVPSGMRLARATTAENGESVKSDGDAKDESATTNGEEKSTPHRTQRQNSVVPHRTQRQNSVVCAIAEELTRDDLRDFHERLNHMHGTTAVLAAFLAAVSVTMYSALPKPEHGQCFGEPGVNWAARLLWASLAAFVAACFWSHAMMIDLSGVPYALLGRHLSKKQMRRFHGAPGILLCIAGPCSGHGYVLDLGERLGCYDMIAAYAIAACIGTSSFYMLYNSQQNRKQLEADAGLVPRAAAKKSATLGVRWFATFLDLLEFGQKHQEVGGMWAGYGQEAEDAGGRNGGTRRVSDVAAEGVIGGELRVRRTKKHLV